MNKPRCFIRALNPNTLKVSSQPGFLHTIKLKTEFCPQTDIRTPSRRLLLPLLASIVAITPLAVDMYLPAMVQIAADLGATMPQVQISLSVYLGGYALGMLFFGPIADQMGRRRLARIGLGLFALCSLALAFCQDIHLFWALRAAQAFTGAAATVVVPGIIRHIYQQNTAKGMSYVSMIMMIAPLIAPSIGSLSLGLAQWQVIFLTLAGYAVFIIVWVQMHLIDIPIYRTSVAEAVCRLLGSTERT